MTDSFSQISLEEKGTAVEYREYLNESELPAIMQLVDNELSEPYSIFTYRYLINQWPQLCYTAYVDGQCVGTIVCKIDDHKSGIQRGYIAMLVVISSMRGRGIATGLVFRSIEMMRVADCKEVTLEAEVTNESALALYSKLGFLRAKRLHRHYLNGADAFRLKLRFPRAKSQVDLDARYFAEKNTPALHPIHETSLGSQRQHHAHEHGPGCQHHHH